MNTSTPCCPILAHLVFRAHVTLFVAFRMLCLVKQADRLPTGMSPWVPHLGYPVGVFLPALPTNPNPEPIQQVSTNISLHNIGEQHVYSSL